MNVANTGGRTGYYTGFKPYANEELYFTYWSISNPRHSTQSATGDMAFTGYDPLTGIATWTSTANAVWNSASGLQSRQTRARVQFQPYTGSATGPLSTGWLVPTTAGDAGITNLPANYPVLDVSALADPGSFQVWAVIEDVATGQAILNYYNSSNSTSGGSFVTGTNGGFYSVADSTVPVISGTATPTRLTVGSELPDYRTQFSITDNDPSPTVVQTPAPGTVPAQGTLSVTITATDIAGNPGTYSFDVQVAAPAPAHTPVYQKGATVAAAGVDPRIKGGALWAGFGVPAVTDTGKVAYLGKWKAPKTEDAPAQSGFGIFIDNTLIVKVGDPVAGISGATWKSFSAPVVATNDAQEVVIAFIGKIRGNGITSENDSVVVTSALSSGGALTVIAREGDVAPAAGGAVYKAFSSVALLPGADLSVLWTGTLEKGSGNPAVTAESDRGAWVQKASAVSAQLVVREGALVAEPSIAGDKVKYFTLLRTMSGIAGASIGGSREGRVYYRAFSTKKVAAIGAWSGEDITVAGVTMLHRPGESLEGYEGLIWKDAGVPITQPASLDFVSVGRLQTSRDGLAASRAGVITVFEGGETPLVVAQLGDQLYDGSSRLLYKKFGQPVLAHLGQGSAERGVAFTATVTGEDVKLTENSVLVWTKFGETESETVLLAREGAEAPDASAGARWKAFTSLSLPSGGGPIFTATLIRQAAGQGSEITSANDFGCWAVDSAGELRGLFREGDTLNGKTLKSFNVLKAVSGAAGVSRATTTGKLVWLATFTDRSTAVIVTEIP